MNPVLLMHFVVLLETCTYPFPLFIIFKYNPSYTHFITFSSHLSDRFISGLKMLDHLLYHLYFLYY